eukprot:6046514-Amphidinium_carterae.2
MIGKGVPKLRVATLTRGASERGLLLSWPSNRLDLLIEAEVDMTKTIPLKEICGNEVAHYSWILCFLPPDAEPPQAEEEEEEEDEMTHPENTNTPDGGPTHTVQDTEMKEEDDDDDDDDGGMSDRGRHGKRPLSEASRSRDDTDDERRPRSDASRSRSRSRDDGADDELVSEADLLGFLQKLNPMSFAAATEQTLTQKEEITDEEVNLAKSGMVTEADLRLYPLEVEAGKDEEVSAFMNQGVFARHPASNADNVIDFTWVLKWKWTKDKRKCRARLCLRGFKDKQKHELNTYASTASRISQRIICSFAAVCSWGLSSIDISTAFLRGHQYSDETRRVYLRANTDLATRIKKYKGFEDFDWKQEVLLLRKSAYGLVDAPKRWFEALTSALKDLNWRPGIIDPAIYFYKSELGELKGILSLHVDDIKVAADKEVTDWLLLALTERFGALKTHFGSFEHCGLAHEQQQDGSVTVHQNHYLDSIGDVPMELLKWARKNPCKLLDTGAYQRFRTLLGQISWLVQSRPEAAVTTSFLQSVANKPSGEHLVQLSLLLKWLRRHKVVTAFPAMRGPFRLLLFSDAAFKPEEIQQPHARRGELLLLTSDGVNGHGTQACHILDYSSRKIPRVARSTYSAELQALTAGSDNAMATSMAYEQLVGDSTHLDDSAYSELAWTGELSVPCDVITDSWSLFQSLTPENTKLPDDKSLVLVLSALREHFATGRIRNVGWCRTQQMLADALSKTTVSKEELSLLSSTGTYRLSSAIWHR